MKIRARPHRSSACIAQPLEPRRLLTGSVTTFSPVQANEPDLQLASTAAGTIDPLGILLNTNASTADAVVLGVYDPDGGSPSDALIVPQTMSFGSPAFTDIFGTHFYELGTGGAGLGTGVSDMLTEVGASVGLPILLGKLYVSDLTLNADLSGQTSDGGFTLAYRFTLSSNTGEPNPLAPALPYVYPFGVGFDFDLTMKWDSDHVTPMLTGGLGTSDVTLDTTVLPSNNACKYVRILPHAVTSPLDSWRYDSGDLTNAGIGSLARLESSFEDAADGIDDASVSEDDFAGASGFLGDGRLGSVLGFASFDDRSRTRDLAQAKDKFVANITEESGNAVSMRFWALVPAADAPIPLHPLLEVRGFGALIEDGDTAASADDGTNFGTVTLDASKLRTFDIKSVGSGALTLGNPAVAIGGTGAASFSVVTQPDRTIEVDDASSFVVRFRPTSVGVQTATITIRSNDATHGDYTFVVKGTGAAGGNVPTFAQLNGATLTLTATAGNDDVSVRRDRTSILAVLNGVTMTFTFSAVGLVAVEGGAGNDRIDLTAAEVGVTVNAGEGDDRILGTSLADSISGNAGRDSIYGGGGNDRLSGNGGRDKLYGDGGADRIYGGASGDWLFGADGDDQLFGEGGNDLIYGGDGADVLHGNAGDDTFASRDGVADQLFGDGGFDRADLDQILDAATSIEGVTEL